MLAGAAEIGHCGRRVRQRETQRQRVGRRRVACQGGAVAPGVAIALDVDRQLGRSQIQALVECGEGEPARLDALVPPTGGGGEAERALVPVGQQPARAAGPSPARP